jgi:hypothetical protein
MGIRGELYSTRVSCEGRTYFFNVKENRMGDVFLTVVESKPAEGESFDRRSIVVFKDDIAEFLKALQGALGFMQGSKADARGAASGAAARALRAPRARAGFAGTENSSEGAAAKEPAAGKKRRVVVRRKDAPPPAPPEK